MNNKKMSDVKEGEEYIFSYKGLDIAHNFLYSENTYKKCFQDAGFSKIDF